MRNANTKRSHSICCNALETTTSFLGRGLVLALFSFILILEGCATIAPKEVVPPQTLPSFVPASAKGRDPALDLAAAALCRENLFVVSPTLRKKLGIRDGQLFVSVERQESLAVSLALLEEKGAKILQKHNATHTGVYIADDDEEPCTALVAAKRSLEVRGSLHATGQEGETVRVRLLEYLARPSLPKGRTLNLKEMRKNQLGNEKPRLTFFKSQPNGQVQRKSLIVDDNHAAILSYAYDAGPGLYTLEVLFDKGDSPEIALLWSVQVGDKATLPPAPKVLFGDEGNSDVALTRRAEALIQRLRTQQVIDVLRIASALADIAGDRANFLSQEGRLGHRLPDGKTALDELHQGAQKFFVSQLAEVQSQGSTLEDAWKALLQSPAHRYEMVNANISHMGVGVVRGKDSVGRPLVTLVAIFAKRTAKTNPRSAAKKMWQKYNVLRAQQGTRSLTSSRSLSKIATAQAQAMAQAAMTDETLLDAGLKNRSVAEVALDSLPKMKTVQSVLARLDDPLRLGANRTLLDAAATHLGIGIARSTADGQWYVCVLVGEEGPPE